MIDYEMVIGSLIGFCMLNSISTFLLLLRIKDLDTDLFIVRSRLNNKKDK